MLGGEHCTEPNHAVHAHVTPGHLRLSKGVRSSADSPRNRSALNYREAFVCLATSGSAGARPPESARWPRGRLRSPPRPGAPRSGQAACASPAAPSPSWGGPQTVLEVSSPRGWEGAPRSLHGQPPRSPVPSLAERNLRLIARGSAWKAQRGPAGCRVPRGPQACVPPRRGLGDTRGRVAPALWRSLGGLRLARRVAGLARDSPATALDAGAAPVARGRAGGGHSP